MSFFRSSSDRLYRDVEELRDFSLSLSALFLKLIFDTQHCKSVVESDVSVSLCSKSISEGFLVCLQLIESV